MCVPFRSVLGSEIKHTFPTDHGIGSIKQKCLAKARQLNETSIIQQKNDKMLENTWT